MHAKGIFLSIVLSPAVSTSGEIHARQSLYRTKKMGFIFLKKSLIPADDSDEQTREHEPHSPLLLVVIIIVES